MKRRLAIFAAFAALVLAFNTVGCVTQSCDEPSGFDDHMYEPMVSLIVLGQIDTPAGQAPEGARRAQLSGDRFVAEYELPDGRVVEETWRVAERRELRTDVDGNLVE